MARSNPAHDSHFAGPCPRCGGGVPNDAQPGAYPGALSRVDNATYICSACGVAEAWFQMLQVVQPGTVAPARYGHPLPPVDQPIRLTSEVQA